MQPIVVELKRVPGGRPNLDGPLVEAADRRENIPTQPLTIRLTPTLWPAEKVGTYDSWPGVGWTVAFYGETDVVVAKAADFRQALERFIDGWVLGEGGTAAADEGQG